MCMPDSLRTLLAAHVAPFAALAVDAARLPA
jgi:hypothetical protein